MEILVSCETRDEVAAMLYVKTIHNDFFVISKSESNFSTWKQPHIDTVYRSTETWIKQISHGHTLLNGTTEVQSFVCITINLNLLTVTK